MNITTIAKHLLAAGRLLTESAWAPFLIFAIVAGLLRPFRLLPSRLPWLAMAAGLSACMVAVAGVYLFSPILFEDVETNIASVSALAMRGLPLYPPMDATARYILLYGPLTYLAHIPFYMLLGKTLFSFKLLGFLAFLTTMAGLYRICRKYASVRHSLVGLGCASVVFFRYIGVEFWGRIDPLVLAMVVLSIWITLEGPVWASGLATAVTFAVLPNLKGSSFAYLLPILALLILRQGWRIALLISSLALLLFTLPFFLPQISLDGYLAILKTAARHPLVAEFLLRSIQYSVLLLAPPLALIIVQLKSGQPPSRDQAIYLAAIVSGMAITCVFGSKSGAGSYHLLPYAAPSLHLYFWLRSDLPISEPDIGFSRFAVPWTLTMLLLSSTHLKTVLTEFRHTYAASQAIVEVRRAESHHKGQTIEVGIGADFYDPRTRYGYLTTFDGQPYTISGAAIRDLQFGHVEIPPATVRYIENCGTQVWLIPKGDAPFIATNTYYSGYHAAFDQRFRNAFLSHYSRVESGAAFDVWSCITSPAHTQKPAAQR